MCVTHIVPAGVRQGWPMEAALDYHWIVLRSVHAVQHGPGEHEHCHSANGRTVWLGYSYNWHSPILFLLVRF